MFHIHINNAYFLERFITKRMILLLKTSLSNKIILLKIAVLATVVFIGTQSGFSQDVYLTQFNYSPLLLNSAQTGNFYGDWRAAINYRNQWSSTGTPYTTAVLSGDKQFSFFNQKIGLGALFISDQSEGINRNKLYASGSYFYKLNENRFSAGLQLGLVFNSPSVGSWGVYNEGTGQHDLPNNEPGTIEKGIYPDINFGLSWQRSIGIFEPELGVALAHLNMPNQSFINSKEKIGITTTIHGSVKTNLNDQIYLFPTFMFASNNANLVSVIGTDVGYNLLGNRSSVKRIYLGGYIRNGISSDLSDFSVLLGTTVGRLDVALNYDVNITTLSSTKHVSTFEISLIYKSISTVLNSYSIPCERF